MASPRVLILRAPGTNCDEETAYAFELCGAKAERVHVNRLIENPALQARYQVLCIPGGFSYGDDIAAGRILASRLNRHLSDMVGAFVDSGDRLVLGICNGMQVLMRLGVLASPATLTWNDHGRFEDRWVHLAVDHTPCVFLRDIERMYLPVAHAEGKFAVAEPQHLTELREQGRLALRYVMGESGGLRDAPLPFPHNPNGSQANAAGLCDASGRVFGLMPHPERYVDFTQHPRWTREPGRAGGEAKPDGGDGLAIFRNAVGWFS